MGALDGVMPVPHQLLDVSGQDCPVPATEAHRHLGRMAPGQVLKVIATDPLAAVDLQILCDRLGHVLLGCQEAAGTLTLWIQVNPERPPAAD